MKKILIVILLAVWGLLLKPAFAQEKAEISMVFKIPETPYYIKLVGELRGVFDESLPGAKKKISPGKWAIAIMADRLENLGEPVLVFGVSHGKTNFLAIYPLEKEDYAKIGFVSKDLVRNVIDVFYKLSEQNRKEAE
ncbi:hypothetical protein HYT00_02075 [Candidatus Giovannonibacteria bacterium]|nr:hypothetical protein [Candidatus Giovannonibacteria bacterium]